MFNGSHILKDFLDIMVIFIWYAGPRLLRAAGKKKCCSYIYFILLLSHYNGCTHLFWDKQPSFPFSISLKHIAHTNRSTHVCNVRREGGKFFLFSASIQDHHHTPHQLHMEGKMLLCFTWEKKILYAMAYTGHRIISWNHNNHLWQLLHRIQSRHYIV